ncbi:hypothetical protein F4803DRAFT_544271 [Xylaria telfairii]|nr:hypothetical protein F4803DRAFT_544271 [Xylaria telfairii]
MPPKKKTRALPRGRRHKMTTNSSNLQPPQVSQPPPPSELRRSKRIRDRELKKASDLPTNNRLVSESRASRSGEAPTLLPSIHRKANPKAQLYSRLGLWLDEVRQAAARGDGIFDMSQSELDRNSMASCSIQSQTSLATSENPSTVIAIKQQGKAKKVSEESLRTRRVEVDGPQMDDWTPTFKEYLVENPVEIPFEATKKLQSSVKDFLTRAENASASENCYDTIEKLCNEINEWKATARLAVVTNQDFSRDLDYCRHPANEAVFQRTVMMSLIDRTHLKEKFDFNCEGQWSLQGTHPLPSTNGPGDIITGPKPDLAIFFRYSALVGADSISKSAAIPIELKSCINPDKYTQRCFPFVFIEAKKGFDNIERAVLANMHTANQALFNIYAWMNRAGDNATFFKDVRVFSVAINAEKVIARVHRARPVDSGDDTELVFSYDDLYPKSRFHYTRDEVCRLIHNVLLDYGEKTLLPKLKKTVASVLKEYKQDLKRKSDTALHGHSAKKLTSAQSQAVDPLTSFGMSRVLIEDS